MQTLAGLASELTAGRVTSVELVEECLENIASPGGEGVRAFVAVDADAARATAQAMDQLRAAGTEPSALAGIPVSVKDLFDVRGQVTRAGSRVLDGAPAAADATAVLRLRRAGLVVLGRTNMTEFAYSGLGMNPHHGTPLNPWDRVHERIPGGSSSGAAVSVADHMAHGALGSDTGGSCRIPAALCGLVGFKPTQAAAPRDGMIPLSPTLDSVGVIGRSVGCCSLMCDVLRERDPQGPAALRHAPRVAVVRNYFFDDVDTDVAGDFERAVECLAQAGASVVDFELPELGNLVEMNAGGGFPAAEAYAWHEELIASQGADYDPRVLVRIRRGEHQTARDLVLLHERRARLIEGIAERLAEFDAFLSPTVPRVAPRLEELADDDEYGRTNLLMLRNPTVVNLIDGCAASVPMNRPETAPTGLMVAGLRARDETVLRVAAWIEEQL